MKDIDMVEKLTLFEDTSDIVKELKGGGMDSQAKHLQELWMLTRQLGAEVKRLRKEKNHG